MFVLLFNTLCWRLVSKTEYCAALTTISNVLIILWVFEIKTVEGFQQMQRRVHSRSKFLYKKNVNFCLRFHGFEASDHDLRLESLTQNSTRIIWLNSWVSKVNTGFFRLVSLPRVSIYRVLEGVRHKVLVEWRWRVLVVTCDIALYHNITQTYRSKYVDQESLESIRLS